MWPHKQHWPKDLMVGENLWEIKFKRKLIEGGVPCTGLCDPSDRIIYVKYPQTNEELFSTLIHEVIHAIEFEYDANIGEYKVRKFEKGLMQFFEQVFFGA